MIKKIDKKEEKSKYNFESIILPVLEKKFFPTTFSPVLRNCVPLFSLGREAVSVFIGADAKLIGSPCCVATVKADIQR